ncbi:MAG: biotin-dependent carboxyltransferase family protein, partial [Bacteroidetes bacterium]
MSLHVLKAGLLDSIQDNGRWGHTHLGINPGGAMDMVSMQTANFLVGNNGDTPVLEMHFPAPELRLESDALLALSGGDFSPLVNDQPVRVNTPVLLRSGATIRFARLRSGVRCYLAVHGGFDLKPWLGSYSTNLKARAGGWQGRALRTGDTLPFRQAADLRHQLKGAGHLALPWSAAGDPGAPDGLFRFCTGPEYDWLDAPSKKLLETSEWQVNAHSDRMACLLNGPTLRQQQPESLISGATVPGTIQLLPSGRLVVLMADGQTTGGYPRIGNIISADLPRLAQVAPGP